MFKYTHPFFIASLLLAAAAHAETSFVVADIRSGEAPRFMSLDAVRAGIPSGSDLRPMPRDRTVNATSVTDSIAPRLVGVARPGFMPIKRDTIIPTPSRGVPMHQPLPVAAETMRGKPSSTVSVAPKIPKSQASPLLDLFGSRHESMSNNFYDAMRSKNGAR